MQPTSLSRQKVHFLISEGEYVLAKSPHPERARRDAETLLLHLFQRRDPERNLAWLIAHWNNPTDHSREFRALIERRLSGEPIQYITGETEFYGLPFRVTPDVLIPRPETEHLVEKALELAASFTAPRIVDVGCGSGAIAVALARLLPHQPVEEAQQKAETHPSGAEQAAEKLDLEGGGGFNPRIKPIKSMRALAPEERILPISPENLPFSAACKAHHFLSAIYGTAEAVPFQNQTFNTGCHATITAIDLSAPALAIARENAELNGISARIRFLCGDLLTPVAGERFEMVVSNPPYVPVADRAGLAVEVRDYEPELALFAGDDGLDLYRRLIPAAFDALTPGGFLLLEIGFGQSPAVGELLARTGFERIEFVPDLQGIPRVACARRAG
jgi:release factor glutamine methyltransferase